MYNREALEHTRSTRTSKSRVRWLGETDPARQLHMPVTDGVETQWRNSAMLSSGCLNPQTVQSVENGHIAAWSTASKRRA